MEFVSMNFPEKSLYEALMDLLSVSNSHCEIFIENSHQHHETPTSANKAYHWCYLFAIKSNGRFRSINLPFSFFSNIRKVASFHKEVINGVQSDTTY